MPAQTLKYRQIKRRTASRGGAWLGCFAALVGLLTVLVLAGLGVMLRLAAQLPDVGEIEAQFGRRGAEQYQPVTVFDRTGEVPLYRHLNPGAERYRWVELSDLPSHVAGAAVAALEPGFWSNSEAQALAAFDPSSSTIAERLVRSSLLPPVASPLERELSGALLANQVVSRFPKERILAWYLNSADFGSAAYGIDAAALVYFGKHAGELSLGEAALLAGMAADPSLDPSRHPDRIAELQAQVLRSMPELSDREVQRALDRPLHVRAEAREWERPGFADYLMVQLQQVVGPEVLGRSGLQVISTLDQELQDQSACAAESHLLRLSGAELESTVPAGDGRPCAAAGLLPTLRPGDGGLSHQVDDWALVVLDPQTGQVLAAHGAIEARRTAGPSLDPFIYLTAFTRGSAPASMVLDIGPEPGEAHGPVRMRTALANLYSGATNRVLLTVGTDAVERTLRQIGLARGAEAGDSVGLLDLTSAYGVFAAEGLQSGLGSSGGSVRPSMLLAVREAEGTLLYEFTPSSSVILSPQLAYLLADVLSDEAARWPSLRQGNVLELGFPAGAVAAVSADMHSNWTIGFSPDRVVGVWLGGAPLHQIDRQNGASSIWHAVMRYASSELSPRGWERPPGISLVEVCDPSGLLPTSYCPSVVREVFAGGTEPTHFDNLYRPVRVNRETGKLATLFTPLESVEERVYFVPPPAAAEWAESVGLELPPEEYDPLSGAGLSWPGVSIRSPDPFEIVGDRVAILGEAALDDFEYYRLQYGQGLNPVHWVQIGTDQRRQVTGGRLGSWATESLNGLYTLQLLVILADGQVRTAAVPVTIDNQPPEAHLIEPQQGDRFSLRASQAITLRAEVTDEVAVRRVEFLVDGLRVATRLEAPFRAAWTPDRIGLYELAIRAYDAAGNRTDGGPVLVTVEG